MTAPICPQPPRIFWLACFGLIVTLIAWPFAQHYHFVKLLLFGFIAIFGAVLLIVMAVSATQAVLAWCRDKPIEPDDPCIGECYTEHIYMVSWNHDTFSLKTHSGELVDQVPLINILDVFDIEEHMIHGNVTISMPKKEVSFPSSRSEEYKLYKLIGKLASSCAEIQHKIEQLRVRLTRQFVKWLSVSLLAAAFLLLPILAKLEPSEINIFWGIAGCVYGMSWVWAFRKFAYAMASFFGARKLHDILQ